MATKFPSFNQGLAQDPTTRRIWYGIATAHDFESHDGMTEEKLDAILAKQVPDAEKRDKADYIVDTSRGLANAREQVKAIIEDLRRQISC